MSFRKKYLITDQRLFRNHYVSLDTGQKLIGASGQVDGLQVKTRALFAAPQTMAEIGSGLAADYQVRDWSQTQGSLFQAIKMEKIMVSVLLLCVVAVAAFNIILICNRRLPRRYRNHLSLL